MDRFDVLILLGLLVVSLGAGLIYIPAGIIMFGLSMTGYGIAGAMAKARSKP